MSELRSRRAERSSARRGPAVRLRSALRSRSGPRLGPVRSTRRWVVALGLVAVLLLAVGALLATAARPVHRTTATLPTTSAAPLVVLSPELLGARDGQVVVSARGSGPVLVARGSAADVRAWVQGTAATSATGLDADGGVRVERTGGGASSPDPSGSDLWTGQQQGQGTAEMALGQIAPGGGPAQGGQSSQAVLVASDGTAPAPARVELTWSSRPVPPLAVVLIAAGAASAAAAGTAVARAALRARGAAEAAA